MQTPKKPKQSACFSNTQVASTNNFIKDGW